MKVEPGLAEKYKSLGTNYAKQREFRLGWAADSAEAMRLERIVKEKSIELDEDAGTFEPIEVIAKREGGGRAGWRAAQNYVQKCIDMTVAGISWRGRCLVEYNSWTKRFEVAYIKKTFRSSFERSWEKRVITDDLDNDKKQTTASGSTAAIAAAVPETPVKDPKAKKGAAIGDKKNVVPPEKPAKRKAKGGKDGLDHEDKEETPEQVAKKKAKKDNDVLFNKGSKLKVKHTTIAASMAQICKNVELQLEEWLFATSDVPAMTAIMTSITAVQGKSQFWKDWFLSDASEMRRRYSVEQSNKEMLHLHDVSEKVDALEKIIKKVMAMYRAGQASLK